MLLTQHFHYKQLIYSCNYIRAAGVMRNSGTKNGTQAYSSWAEVEAKGVSVAATKGNHHQTTD